MLVREVGNLVLVSLQEGMAQMISRVETFFFFFNERGERVRSSFLSGGAERPYGLEPFASARGFESERPSLYIKFELSLTRKTRLFN